MLNNAEDIRDYIYERLGKAAELLGQEYKLYRPTNTTFPTRHIDCIKSSFNVEDYNYGRNERYGHSLWFAVLDGRKTKNYDYLIGPEGTWFITRQIIHLPIMCVKCSHTLSLLKPNVSSRTGVDTTTLFSGFPAALEADSPGSGTLDLPQSQGQGEFKIYLPAIPGLPVIQTGYVFVDQNHEKYTVKAAEFTDKGYRIWSNKTKH